MMVQASQCPSSLPSCKHISSLRFSLLQTGTILPVIQFEYEKQMENTSEIKPVKQNKLSMVLLN